MNSTIKYENHLGDKSNYTGIKSFLTCQSKVEMNEHDLGNCINTFSKSTNIW